MNLLVFLFLPDLPLLIYDLGLRILLYKQGDVIHQTVGHRIMRYDCCHTDHNDLVRVLLITLCYRNMVFVLQPGDKALYDHSFLFQTVNPFGPQSEGHYGYSHLFLLGKLTLPLPVYLS